MSQYLNSDKHFELSEKIAKAIAEYLDGNGAYPFAILRMPVAEYVVDEIDAWIGWLVTNAIDLERQVGG